MPSAIKPKPKSKRGRPSLESQRVLYQIKIHGWDVSWSFGLASSYYSRADEGSYSEYLILTLRGKVMYPEGFKYSDVECQLSADPRLSQDATPATSIGSLTASESQLMAYIPVRRERMGALIAGADRFRNLQLNAAPLRYRRALVMSINLDSEEEPDS